MPARKTSPSFCAQLRSVAQSAAAQHGTLCCAAPAKQQMSSIEVLSSAYQILQDLTLPQLCVFAAICSAVCCILLDVVMAAVSQAFMPPYRRLKRVEQHDWDSRLTNIVHATVVTVMAWYLVYFSDTFNPKLGSEPLWTRSSKMTWISMGISLGYFVVDTGMMLWYYPHLGTCPPPSGQQFRHTSTCLSDYFD
jgi:hypothetical protein